MVSFPIKGDYSNLVNKEVYYYESNNLRRGNLSSISLQSGKFMIDGTEHNTTDFLGQPSGGILILGSVLGFLTEKIVTRYVLFGNFLLLIIGDRYCLYQRLMVLSEYSTAFSSCVAMITQFPFPAYSDR